MKSKIVICWPGFTGYMGACWQALARLAQVKIFIEPSKYEQSFDGADLEGLDWHRVENVASEAEGVIGEIRAFAPDIVLICGWSTPLSRAVTVADLHWENGREVRKILAFDMPWEWSIRKFAAKFVLWPHLRHFSGAFVPGARCAKYARWLGFGGRIVEGSNPSGWERFCGVSPAERGFVYVGRRALEKGLDVLEAAYALYRERVADPWPLDLVGGDTFVRPEDVPGVLGKHAALILPSLWEPWGIAAAEAMCGGLMTIMSKACGLCSDVRPTRLVATGDVEALAQAMVEVHRMSRRERELEAVRVRTMMARYSAENWARRLVFLAEKMGIERRIVASFWEEHCCECGMPVCYETCEMFERGWHRRCVRVDGFCESVLGAGKVRFRRWGKIEMMYHGGLISMRMALWLERINRWFGGVWRLLGAYHRAIRWRIADACGRKAVPDVWRIVAESDRDEVLCATIAYEDGREIFREPLVLRAGCVERFEWALPKVEDGALFRLFSFDGERTGEIELLENYLSRSEVDLGENEGESGRTLKCVIWDLDGVMWQGVLSEGDDVALNRDVVRIVKRLDEAGVVNSICSKNDYDVAIAKLKELGIEEYFVFPKISWLPKSGMIRELQKEMNIGFNAMAFVDDREENREDVRANCAGVWVLGDGDVHELCVYFAQGKSGVMGMERRLQYRAEMERRGVQAMQFNGDAQAFLEQSGLRVELLPLREGGDEMVERCRELVNRTNQLTITARRYNEDEFRQLLAWCEARAVHVCDKYGDYGVVGFVAWSKKCVEEMVFSCRVAHKGIEVRVLGMLPKGLSINVVKTDRNGPIREIIKEWSEKL